MINEIHRSHFHPHATWKHIIYAAHCLKIATYKGTLIYVSVFVYPVGMDDSWLILTQTPIQ